MNKIYIYFLLLIACIGLASCNFLDIVPNESATEADAFKDKNAAERYLYSCYAFMPRERLSAYLYPQGETMSSLDGSNGTMEGNYTASNPGNFTFWSLTNGGIKRCYQLINNVDQVPHMNEDDKTIYKAEAKFLIAYFHFYLLKAYGPIIIWDKEPKEDMSVSDMPKRSKFDDCVKFISELLDEAYNDMLWEQEISSYGRATKITAKAIKSRVLLYAASPLFNGNSEFYSNFLDPETSEPLMNLTENKEKWKNAYDAAVEAINLAKEHGIELYKKEPTSTMPEPANPVQFALRMSYVDRENNEVIWADTRKEPENSIHNCCTPRDLKSTVDASWNGVGPTLEVIKSFYTENGLPIDEDPAYYGKNEYFEKDNYLSNGPTCKLHLKREPRFYAWISFHNGFYELQRNKGHKIVTQYGKKDEHGWGDRGRNYTMTGYLWKKGTSPAYSTESGVMHYGWPLIRLAELYLNAAEAAAEYGILDEAKANLNKVRERAGIPDIEVSWKGKTLDQNRMCKIVRQERTIELCFEGHHIWDLRRWKEAATELNKNPHGLNIAGDAVTGSLFQETEISANWKFSSPTNYLLPIPFGDTNVNVKLVQNPGY